MNTETSETILKRMEILETVLNEASEDANAARKAVIDLHVTVIGLCEKVDGFDQRLQEQKVIVSPVDTGPIEEAVNTNIGKAGSALAEGLVRINETLERQPKPIVRQFKFSLLPDGDPYGNNRKLYYKIMWWLYGLLFLVMLFRLGTNYIETIPRREYAPVERLPDPAPPFQHHVEKKFKK